MKNQLYTSQNLDDMIDEVLSDLIQGRATPADAQFALQKIIRGSQQEAFRAGQLQSNQRKRGNQMSDSNSDVEEAIKGAVTHLAWIANRNEYLTESDIEWASQKLLNIFNQLKESR